MGPKPTFGGYATKANIRCTDGRVIMPGAFKHQDGERVPLVWSHIKDSPTSILGYAKLEARPDGMYATGYFNDTETGRHMRDAVLHGDVTDLSIRAGELVQKGSNVHRGEIKELSLVMRGANSGAFIDNLFIEHSDGGQELDETSAIMVVGSNIELLHEDEDDMTQKNKNQDLEHEGTETVKDVLDTLSEKQMKAVTWLIGAALEEKDASHGTEDDDDLEHEDAMPRNVFQSNGKKPASDFEFTHEMLEDIKDYAEKSGSLKEAFLAHAEQYGIENIDILFPDAKNLYNTPQFISRRMEWVQGVLGGTTHSPFARVKMVQADITADDARAKGYVKGTRKKEEVFKLLTRKIAPTTIYKKQKLDRDDIIDITDLDVVQWMRSEMRLMLDEELARAVLVGDGRAIEDEDKISEDHLIPIAIDDELYAHQVLVPSAVTGDNLVEYMVRQRDNYKGSGNPSLYTTNAVINDLLWARDKIGRRLYNNVADLATALRVAEIVEVEVLEAHPDILGIVVNLRDYTIGADKGGQVSMFDDFDIDYNQYKYLIETRISGALTRIKSALVFRRAAVSSEINVNLTAPVQTGNSVVITNDVGVTWEAITATGGSEPIMNTFGPLNPLVITDDTEIRATAKPGYVIVGPSTWTFGYVGV